MSDATELISVLLEHEIGRVVIVGLLVIGLLLTIAFIMTLRLINRLLSSKNQEQNRILDLTEKSLNETREQREKAALVNREIADRTTSALTAIAERIRAETQEISIVKEKTGKISEQIAMEALLLSTISQQLGALQTETQSHKRITVEVGRGMRVELQRIQQQLDFVGNLLKRELQSSLSDLPVTIKESKP